jgi:hypothetical protein
MGFLVPCFGCRVAAIMTFVPPKVGLTDSFDWRYSRSSVDNRLISRRTAVINPCSSEGWFSQRLQPAGDCIARHSCEGRPRPDNADAKPDGSSLERVEEVKALLLSIIRNCTWTIFLSYLANSTSVDVEIKCIHHVLMALGCGMLFAANSDVDQANSAIRASVLRIGEIGRLLFCLWDI